MSTARRPALPSKTHPMEDIVSPAVTIYPSADETQEGPVPSSMSQMAHIQAKPAAGGEVQLNVRIDSDVNRAFERALLTLSAARGKKVTKKAGVQEAIALLLKEHKL